MAMSPVIYHNPRCSKSRQTLALLSEASLEPQIIEYLEEGLAELEIRDLATALGCGFHELLRTKEAAYTTHDLHPQATDSEIIAALLESPELLERPIVITEQGARFGRPPETIREILP